MLLGSSYIDVEKCIILIKKYIEKYFKNDMQFIKQNVDISHGGWFEITYKYLPRNYTIIIEHEYKRIDISIENEYGDYTSLYNEAKIRIERERASIKNSICMLNKVLTESNELNFFRVKNDKLYKLIDGKFVRIRM